jgi:hypothetical protein
MVAQSCLGTDHGAILCNHGTALRGPVGRCADLQEHFATAGVINDVLTIERLPQGGAEFAQIGGCYAAGGRRWDDTELGRFAMCHVDGLYPYVVDASNVLGPFRPSLGPFRPSLWALWVAIFIVSSEETILFQLKICAQCFHPISIGFDAQLSQSKCPTTLPWRR